MNETIIDSLATYETRQAAQSVVDDLDSGIYHLSHGEYARPEYKVRKIRGKNRYYIHARRYYYAGTFRARPSGALTVEDV